MKQTSLFDDTEKPVFEPLASRMRPERLEDLWDRTICWEMENCCAG